MIYNTLEDAKKDLEWFLTTSAISYIFPSKTSKHQLHHFKETLHSTDDRAIKKLYEEVANKNHLKRFEWISSFGSEHLPVLAFVPSVGVIVIMEHLPEEMYKCDTPNGVEFFHEFPKGTIFSHIKVNLVENKKKTAISMFKNEAYKQKKYIIYAAIASIGINILALGTSFFSMQVYDRVIPTGGLSTLTALSIGVFIAIFLEMVVKISRSLILDHAAKNLDITYSHTIFNRFLQVRCDNLPKSIGTLSGQLQGYGAIRSFISSAALYFIVDFPFSIIFLLVITAIGGWQMGLVSIVFMVVSIITGMLFRKKIDELTKTSTMASHKKLGLLVETVENAENIKSTGQTYNLLNKWNELTINAVDDDLKIKHFNELSNYMAAFFQQVSYVVLVALGAYLVATDTTLTMGSLIAITILSGRVLSPIAQLSGIFVQWGKAKISVEDLENVFKLKVDNDGISRALSPTIKNADIYLKDVKFGYIKDSITLNISSLQIKEGEKVAILGIIGSGKTTLLKILSGLYMPQNGNSSLNGIDMQHISRNTLNEIITYVPQNFKLFSGTIRDNLTLGLIGKTDDEILDASKDTGLINLISALPEGLDTKIPEGGESVSGGQKQLFAITRALLAKPRICLLDEPTASMDEMTERNIIQVLINKLPKNATLVVVTHKPILLSAVNRVIVMTPQGIVMDGPKQQVIQQLQTQTQTQTQAQRQPVQSKETNEK